MTALTDRYTRALDHALSRIFTRRGCKPASVFDAEIDRMHHLAGGSQRKALPMLE